MEVRSDQMHPMSRGPARLASRLTPRASPLALRFFALRLAPCLASRLARLARLARSLRSPQASGLASPLAHLRSHPHSPRCSPSLAAPSPAPRLVFIRTLASLACPHASPHRSPLLEDTALPSRPCCGHTAMDGGSRSTCERRASGKRAVPDPTVRRERHTTHPMGRSPIGSRGRRSCAQAVIRTVRAYLAAAEAVRAQKSRCMAQRLLLCEGWP